MARAPRFNELEAQNDLKQATTALAKRLEFYGIRPRPYKLRRDIGSDGWRAQLAGWGRRRP
jgi:hypothetical protein